jgi:hypothetical protein
MAPVAAAGLVMIASLMTIAAAIGAVGGVITALLRRNLAWGALVTIGVYFVLSPLISKLISALVGLLPLTVTFLIAALTTGWLQSRSPKPLAALIGLILGLGAGFCYMLPLRFDIWAPMDKRTPWIALIILLGLVIGSIGKRRRVAAITPPSVKS